MEFVRRVRPARRVLALLPGAWNPPTRAHVALAESALAVADELVFVVPRRFPHKTSDGPPLESRLEWVTAVASADDRFSVSLAEGGLFIEMAREARAATPGVERIHIVCGRDAAERALWWDYGEADPIAAQLHEYSLLVAPRGGYLKLPGELRHGVLDLAVPGDWDEVSSTEVRQRQARGEAWEHLVPEAVLQKMIR